MPPSLPVLQHLAGALATAARSASAAREALTFPRGHRLTHRPPRGLLPSPPTTRLLPRGIQATRQQTRLAAGHHRGLLAAGPVTGAALGRVPTQVVSLVATAVPVPGDLAVGVHGVMEMVDGDHSAPLAPGLTVLGESSLWILRSFNMLTMTRTAWWGSASASGGCPGSSWSGWTSGSWSTNAPWTTWSGCSASTTATSVYSTTISGVPTQTTSYGFQVAQAQAASTGSSGSAASASATPTGAAGKKEVAMGGAVVAFVGAVALL